MTSDTRFVPYVLLLLVCAGLFFWDLGATPLIGLDEGFYAEVSREMLVSGNYVVPTHNGKPFLDKPPLCYWLQAGAMKAFGVSSFAARLPSAASAAALVALTTFLGTKMFSRRAGLLAGFALACSTLTVGTARLAVMDQVFALCIATSLGAFALSAVGSRRLAIVRLVFWAAMGGALLVKGPAGAVLIVLVAGVYAYMRRDAACVRGIVSLSGVLLMLLIAVPWYVLAQRDTGGTFLWEFIVHQNLMRAAGTDFSHNMPVYFYIPIYMVGLFPWSFFTPSAWIKYVKSRASAPHESAALFAGVWIAVTIVLFSLLRSKLPAYIYPAWPPSTLLVGWMWDRAVMENDPKKLSRGFAWALGFSVLAAGTVLPLLRGLEVTMPGLGRALVWMLVFMVSGPLAGLVLVKLKQPVMAFVALAAGMTGCLIFAGVGGMPAAARVMSGPMVSIARDIHRLAKPGQKAFVYELSPPQPGIAFYAGRFVPELKGFEAFTRATTAGESVLVVMQESDARVPRRIKVISRRWPYALCRFSGQNRELH